MKYKMVCIDMDGTLLGKGKKISEYNKKIIKRAHDVGIEIVVTTGRLYNNAAYFSKLLGVNSPVIAANGAIVIEQKTNEILYEAAIPKNDCREIYNVLKKHKILFHFHTTDTIYCSSIVSKIGTELYMAKQVSTEDLYIRYFTVKDKEWKDVFNKESGKMAKCIAFSLNKGKILKVKKELSKISNIVCYASGDNSLEINFRGVSKGNAVKALIDKYDIKPEELMCIGDNENDISMIKFAGLGVAMGNAINDLKAVADYVTDTNKKDGVAKAIEKYILNKD